MTIGVESNIARAIAYLQAVQAEDGHFDSFSSPTKQPFRPVRSYQTTFVSSLVLQALSQTPAAMSIRAKLAAWLLTQKNDAWSFNYWATESPERLTLPYPDDLDDTFCALIALYRHDPSLIDASVLGKVVRLLLATESKVGGPYRTWLVTKDTPGIWQDIDLAVNSNIAYFLQLVAQALPNVTTHLAKHIIEGQFSSPYYPSIYPLLYYLSRAYRGEAAPQLLSMLKRQRREGHWGTPLQTALGMSALDELGFYDELGDAIHYLISHQLPDGSWQAEAFCLDPAQSGKQHYNGSAALTTALVIEALQRLADHTSTIAAPSQPKDQVAESLQGRILTEAHKQYSELDPTLRTHTANTLERMVQGDHSREIVLLPYFFAKALRSGKPPTQLLVRLGLANLYGWTAYTIFDDFLDGSGDIQLLSVATSSMRYSLEQFQTALPNSQIYQQFVRQTFNTIDCANAWEIQHCRFKVDDQQKITIGALPDYGALEQLAQRSFGHVLTPLGVLVSQGTMPTSAAARRLILSLRHYLIARQLYDDLLDWETDMRAGQCSYVVQQLLQAMAIKPGLHELDELIPIMQQAFWTDILPSIGKTLLHHAELAKQYLTKSHFFTSENDVTQLISRLHASVVEALDNRAQAQDFLASYRAT